VFLDVIGTKVTEAGIAKLQKKLPKCTIWARYEPGEK